MTWIQVQAVTVTVGDLTPAGPVVGIVYLGDEGRVELDVEGRLEPFVRGFGDTVPVHRPTIPKLSG